MSIDQSQTFYYPLLIPDFFAGITGKDLKRKPKEPPRLKVKYQCIQGVKGLAWDQLLVEARLSRLKLWSGVHPDTTALIPTERVLGTIGIERVPFEEMLRKKRKARSLDKEIKKKKSGGDPPSQKPSPAAQPQVGQSSLSTKDEPLPQPPRIELESSEVDELKK